MKAILFLSVTLACFAIKGAHSVCSQQTGSSSLTGSTSASAKLDFLNAEPTAGAISVNQQCIWDITCPSGTFVFVGKVKVMASGGWSTGDSLEFFDEPSHAALDTYTDSGHGAWGWSAQYIGRRALYNTEKVRIEYNTGSSGTSSGFSLNYKCYTTRCPAELVSKKIFSTAADERGFEFINNQPCPGTQCTFNFACPNPSDIVRISHKQRDTYHTRYSTTSMKIESTSDASNSFTVPFTSNSVGLLGTATPIGTSTLAPSSGGSYTVTYTTPALVHNDQLNYIFDSAGAVSVTAFCHPATTTTCYNPLRDDATLTNGYGVIRNYGNADCTYAVTCPGTATGILFVSSREANPTYGVPDTHVYTTADGSVSILATPNSGGSYVKNWDLDGQYVFSSGTSAYITIADSKADIAYSCQHPTCNISAQSGLSGQTKVMTSTTLRANTIIPQTDETQFFNSDADGDGGAVTAGSAFVILSSESGQSCAFAVQCPAGMFVLFNLSGQLKAEDSIVATGNGITYNLSVGAKDKDVPHSGSSLITAANTLSWTQTSHYTSGYSTGYQVRTGCTSFVAGTCPMPTTHFSALSSAALDTNVTLDTYVETSGSEPYQLRLVPAGYSCDFPISCPAGSYIKVDVTGLGFAMSQPSAAPQTPTKNRPFFKDSLGNELTTDSYLLGHLGVQSATLSWTTTDWTFSETYAVSQRGFYLNVSCDSDIGPTRTDAPTPAPTPVPTSPQTTTTTSPQTTTTTTSPPTPVPTGAPTPAPTSPATPAPVSVVYPPISLMTEVEAKAEQERLQNIHSWISNLWNEVTRKYMIPKDKENGDKWTAAGCGPSYNCTQLYNATCCKGSSAPYQTYSRCEDHDDFERCTFGCTANPMGPQCSLATYELDTVCGTDSTSTAIAAVPMADMTKGCSTGPRFGIDGLYETGSPSVKVPVNPDQFFADAANNTNRLDVFATPRRLWIQAMLPFVTLTNAANVSSGQRAAVVFESTMELQMVHRAKNNGHFVVNGTPNSHFVAIDATNYATADNFHIIGGNATILGANSGGPMTCTTSNTVRLLNILNAGNVVLTNSPDVFIGNVVSSGNISATGTANATRVLYNVSATGSSQITIVSGRSALYYVDTSAGARINILGGSHSVSHSTNAGALNVVNCTSLTLINATNTGSITVVNAGTITGSMLSNIGGTIIVTGGGVIDLTVVANTGTIILASGVTGTIQIPTGSTGSFTGPSTVTVVSAQPATMSGSTSTAFDTTTSGSAGNLFDTGSGVSAVSGVLAAVMTAMMTVLLL